MQTQTDQEGGIRVIKAHQGTARTAQMAGAIQQELFAGSGTWIGMTSSPAGTTSPWHHHGEYDTYVYLLSGRRRLEFGVAGGSACDADAGDLIIVPKGVVHREVNTGGDDNLALIVRLGSGPSMFKVNGPPT